MHCQSTEKSLDKKGVRKDTFSCTHGYCVINYNLAMSFFEPFVIDDGVKIYIFQETNLCLKTKDC